MRSSPDGVERVAGPAGAVRACSAETAARRNARDLEQELAWFSRVLDARFRHYFNGEVEVEDPVSRLLPPDPATMDSKYGEFLRSRGPGFAERMAVVLALVPHVRPSLLDIFFTRNQNFDRRFSEFGGVVDRDSGGFRPTGATLAFLLGGADLETRFAVQDLFDRDSFLIKQGILGPDSGHGDRALMEIPLRLSREYLELFTTGHPGRPQLSAHFPAQYIETALDWEDLVLHPGTERKIREIETWLRHRDTLMHGWGMHAKLRPGYRSLLYGPPGTGKTMTACLLGKATAHDVYRIDLSLVVSKYIGETEKNLAGVFDRAQHQGWILFFDEADALFGKRSETRDAHDRFANQEVSFLLQRIESFDGIAILASNQRENMDDAFARRFESMIYFPMPRPEERLRLWRQGFSAKSRLDAGTDLEDIAERYELSGGAIMNVIRYASLQAIEAGGNTVTREDLLDGIRRELAKEGKAA